MDHTITALTLQKRNRQRVSVYLDGEFAFGLARIVAAWLQVDMRLSDEKIAELKAEDERETAYQRALNLISYRPRAKAEIRQNLERHKIREEIILYVLERLENSGLVDDARFAQTWVENRSELRPRSQRAIAFELRQHGLEPDVIESVIAAVDDEEMAYQAAMRQARKTKKTNWREFRQKMLRHLAQRGFSYETSAEAVRRVWEENGGTEPQLDERA